ncbi:hypothetical protein R4P48_05090 [Atlantibacter subterranea]|uniref:Uncharacterized protein n=1 Tax=Atlantibacter subterraneus TaxID=255519 RepID=A0ABU4DYX5_9ENTR|nr:hypothetical protein [Atlantibacter subterranea]MDV7022055.1 hypothetical protein [Atlantibacter subterranea]MDZ5665600.1 hypothetical protein [Atlantibacter hermannii]
MRRFIILSLSTISLLSPSICSALTISGKIHPERYTFFLNEKGGTALMRLNERMIAFYQSEDAGNVGARYAISDSGYRDLGVAPAPLGTSESATIRDDGKPVKALTCIMSTVPVSTVMTEQLWCKDDVGAEYIGFKSWPHRDIVKNACRVGDDNCPVYFSLQGDDPTIRDDSVKFTSVHPPKREISRVPQVKKPDPAIIENLKTNGCDIINQYKKSLPKCGSVLDVSGGGVPADSPETPYSVDYTEAGTGWRVQWPVKLIYRGKTLVKLSDQGNVTDITETDNNKPAVTEKKIGIWNVVRNASSVKFSASNASGTQILMTCENREFTVATGQGNSWTSSENPMSQMTFSLGGKELSADETLFDSLKSSTGQTLSVLIMGSANDSGTFSTAGLSDLMSSLSWDNCLYPEKAAQQ